MYTPMELPPARLAVLLHGRISWLYASLCNIQGGPPQVGANSGVHRGPAAAARGPGCSLPATAICQTCGASWGPPRLYPKVPLAGRFFASAAAAAAAKSSSSKETTAAPSAVGAGAVSGNRNESLVDIPVKPKARKFFDAKTFREFLKRFKEHENREENRKIAQQYARPPPEGWDAAEFARRVGLEAQAEAIAAHFQSWGEFVCAAPEDLMAIESLNNEQRRLLLRHLRLFSHGLWPENSYSDFMQRFQAEPLKREGQPWMEEEDARLLELAQQYDANFGDPWLYISWEMQRDFEDVHRRYLDLIVKPKNKGRRCEFALSKCMRPLYFSRYFKILPSTLLIVPTATHFNTKPVSQFILPAPFRCFED